MQPASSRQRKTPRQDDKTQSPLWSVLCPKPLIRVAAQAERGRLITLLPPFCLLLKALLSPRVFGEVRLTLILSIDSQTEAGGSVGNGTGFHLEVSIRGV